MFEKIITGFIRTITMLFLAGIIVVAVVALFQQSIPFGIIGLVGLFLLGLLLLVAIKKLSTSKHFWLWLGLIALGLLIRIAYAFTVDVEVISDQLKCLNAAKQVVQGDFSWATADLYFQRFAYQIPFVLYEGIVLKLFGTVRALYIFNGIFSIGTCFLIFAISKRVCNKSAALIMTAVFSCCPIFIFSIGRLYNPIIAGVFLLVAVYFFVCVCQRELVLESGKSYFITLSFCALSGMFLGISNLFRTEAIIGIIAFECWFVYNFIVSCKKKNVIAIVIRSLLCMLVTYAFYKLVNAGADYAIVHSGISPNGIKNGCPYWFIVCGLTPESFGLYSTKYAYITEYKDPIQQFEVFKNILNEIVADKSLVDVLTFFFKKHYIMWGEVHYFSIFNSSAHIPDVIYTLLIYLNHYIYIFASLLAAIGIKKKPFNSTLAFFSVLLLGFFFVFIIKEIQPVYRYSTILILFLVAASGVDYIMKTKISITSALWKRKDVHNG